MHAIGQCEGLLILEPSDTRTGTPLNVTLQDSRLPHLHSQVLHLTGEERRLEDGQRRVGADGAGSVEGGTRVHTRVAYLNVVDVELRKFGLDLDAALAGSGEVDASVLLPSDLWGGVSCGSAGEFSNSSNTYTDMTWSDSE